MDNHAIGIFSDQKCKANILIDIQGGPAKVRPTYIFDGNIWVNVITVIQAHTLGSIKVQKVNKILW